MRSDGLTEISTKSAGDASVHRSVMKIVVGAASTAFPGWLSTDISTLDVIKEDSWSSFVGNALLTNVLAEHIWEHLTMEDGRIAAAHAFKHLISPGRMRIAVPDANFPHREYLDMCKVKPTSDHLSFYTVYSLTNLLESVGFTVKPLEYFDNEGRFHINPWSRNDGFISRSLLNDRRNRDQDGTIAYTSLIVDALKH
jgi:predicted SAM-dependent methyltransferase